MPTPSELTVHVRVDTTEFDALLERLGTDVTVLRQPAPVRDEVSAPALVAAAVAVAASPRRLSRRSLLAPWTIRSQT